MFTGIIEEVGKIQSIHKGAESAILTVEGDIIFDDLKTGDSVAVNGVCLTAKEIHKNNRPAVFLADVMHETLNRSSLGSLKPGSVVNLERAMASNGRFGGHIVSGHIDGTGIIEKITKDDNAVWYHILAAPELMRYIVEKGSIAVDGISLTVASTREQAFCVSLIPHTLGNTTLLKKSLGDIVNLENDVIGKYVEKMLLGDDIKTRGQKKESVLTKEFLQKCGY